MDGMANSGRKLSASSLKYLAHGFFWEELTRREEMAAAQNWEFLVSRSWANMETLHSLSVRAGDGIQLLPGCRHMSARGCCLGENAGSTHCVIPRAGRLPHLPLEQRKQKHSCCQLSGTAPWGSCTLGHADEKKYHQQQAKKMGTSSWRAATSISTKKKELLRVG